MKKGRYGLTDNSDIASLERENSKSIGHNSKAKAVCDTKVGNKMGQGAASKSDEQRGPKTNSSNKFGAGSTPNQKTETKSK